MAKLVLIPGLVSDHHIWRHAVKALAAYHPIIADVSQTTSIADIATQILGENDGQLYIAGHSMGGIIAVEIYRQAPERIEKLALLNSSMMPQMDGEAEYRQSMIDMVNEGGIEALAKNWLPRLVHQSRHDDADFMAEIASSIMAANAKIHEKQNNALLGRPDGYLTIEKITCPTLVLAARQDKLCRVTENEDIASKINGSQLVIVEDCAHFAPLERPDTVNQALKNWLNT
ncbi:MAG: alpha/beta hydrolase [Alphaproteobacteria bacterium]|nr:alpha/beta hydrolase [Alphaproteobacteria bacterium]